MKGLVVLVVITLTWVLTHYLEQDFSRLGEILHYQGPHNLFLIVVAGIMAILYCVVRSYFKADGKAKSESIAKPNPDTVCSPIRENDFYLKRQGTSPDFIECQISTNENAQFWFGRCKLHCGKVRSVVLCAGAAAENIVVNVTQEATGTKYIVDDGRTIIGRIEKTAKGLKYIDTDNNPGGSAVRKTRIKLGLGEFADWLITWDTLTGFNSKSKFQYYLLKDGKDKTIGKYFRSLGNVDLTRDINNQLDRRIAAVFAIFLEYEKMERQENCAFFLATRRLPDFDGVNFVFGAAILIVFSFILYYLVSSLVSWLLW